MKKGFSLIELMIVIIILGLIASLVVPNLIGQSDDAKKKLVCIQMENLMNSLKTFKINNGLYPSTTEGLDALVKNPDPNKYISYPDGSYIDGGKLPLDPWKNRYIYTNTEGTLELISLGADGKEGGSGLSEDILYSTCRE